MTTNGHSSSENVGCDSETKPFVNKFINDGSFLETFKKMQQDQQKVSPPHLQSANPQPMTLTPIKLKEIKISSINSMKKSPTDEKKIISSEQSNNSLESPSSSGKIMLGKRRNQKLKVGIIKRTRKDDEPDDDQDAWTKYMKEVREYKEKYGDDSDKKRPLVK